MVSFLLLAEGGLDCPVYSALSCDLLLLASRVWMQMRMRDLAEAAVRKGLPLPAAYHRLFWSRFAFGFPAFAAVLGIVWLMITRPAFRFFP